MNTEELKKMTAQERKDLLRQLEQEERKERLNKRESYEQLRKEFLLSIEERLHTIVKNVTEFKEWLDGECESFRDVMAEYGQMRNAQQRSFTLVSDKFKVEINSNNIKGFDERAEIAAQRLQNYLNRYIEESEKGKKDPVYKIAMSLLEKKNACDFDYKMLSKLYQYEDIFDDEYSEIMNLFKESHIVQGTALNYYFYQLDKNGIWRKIEPSFCRL